MLAEGRRLLKEGDRARALPFFELATQFSPEDKEIWLLRAEAADDPAEAAKCLEQVVALDPHNEQARSKLVMVRLNALQGAAQATTSRPRQAAPPSGLGKMSRGCKIAVVAGFFALCALLGLGIPAVAVLLRPQDAPVSRQVATAAASATPTSLHLPATWTASPTRAQTSTPTITPTPAWNTTSDVRVRSGPGTNYSQLGTLPAASHVVVVGRSADNKWAQIQYPDASKLAWVYADYVAINSAEFAAFPTALAQTTPQPPTRPPATATKAAIAPAATPTSAFQFVGRSQAATDCSRASPRVKGQVYDMQNPAQARNGVTVAVWAFGQPQGSPVSGGPPTNSQGYWEWNFGTGFDIDGQVAVLNSDGSPGSDRVSFHLDAKCDSSNAVNQVEVDFFQVR